jgi:hypothetical protein
MLHYHGQNPAIRFVSPRFFGKLPVLALNFANAWKNRLKAVNVGRIARNFAVPLSEMPDFRRLRQENVRLRHEIWGLWHEIRGLRHEIRRLRDEIRRLSHDSRRLGHGVGACDMTTALCHMSSGAWGMTLPVRHMEFCVWGVTIGA